MVRTARAARDVATDEDLVVLADPVRRAVAARLSGRSPGIETDDVVQETLTRVWAERWRLERATLLPYALTVARNLVSSAERTRQVERRHGPRLVDPAADPGPERLALAAEEQAAVVRALAALREGDRRLLLEHEVRGVEVDKIAAEQGVSAGAVAARLARARARLRVEHLLALRRVTLPTVRCRGVLDAISLGDRSRQRTLLAAEHLLGCATCSELAEPLLTRRRSLTALAPLVLLPLWLWRLLRAHPVPSAAVGAGAVAVAVVLSRSPAPAPAPPPPPVAQATRAPATLTVGGMAMLPEGRVAALSGRVGQPAVADSAPVQSVPADEGFWIGTGPGHRVWVQLNSRGGESAVHVRPGQRASFPAEVVRATAATPGRLGLTAAEGAAELTGTGAYLMVDPRHLVLR